MILTDAFVVRTWHPENWLRYTVEAVLVVAVIAIGRVICQRGKNAPANGGGPEGTPA